VARQGAPVVVEAPVYGRIGGTLDDYPDLPRFWNIFPWPWGHVQLRYDACRLHGSDGLELFSRLDQDDRQAIDLNLHNNGYDWDAGMPVFAMAPGVVVSLDLQPGAVRQPGSEGRPVWHPDREREFGAVLIDHGSTASAYLHMETVLVKPGDRVTTETQLGTIGHRHPTEAMANHLHVAWYRVVRRPVATDRGFDAILELRSQPCRFIERPFSLAVGGASDQRGALTLTMPPGSVQELSLQASFMGGVELAAPPWLRTVLVVSSDPERVRVDRDKEHVRLVAGRTTGAVAVEIVFSGRSFPLTVLVQ
jgi:hypothetical protein